MATHAPLQGALPRTVAACALPLEGTRHDHDALLHAIGDSTLVLLGEASHGTHEFYSERARLTRRLIEDKGFCAVAVEADWPDAYRINRFVRGRGPDPGPLEALGGFERFPAWMWRNTDVLDFVKWLREHNDAHPHRAAGFYGLDLYSMNTSIEAVLAYLDRIDPEGAEIARRRYGCFEFFGHDTQAYGYATSLGMVASCEDEVVRQLMEIERRAPEYARRSPDEEGEDEAFFVEQNARLVKNAERYYRAMFRGGAASWNLRDEHMAETLDALRAHLGRRHGAPAKVVVWAHNSHLGDALAAGVGGAPVRRAGALRHHARGAAARPRAALAARRRGGDLAFRPVAPPPTGRALTPRRDNRAHMALLTLTNAHLAYGHVPLLDGAGLSLDNGERVGLIGRNGT
ncbi:MAG TPA: erythromycin esterase family protein, partial [Polyangium sp.]|nr:erythromycin esterase family protein [Polyangium sp.]